MCSRVLSTTEITMAAPLSKISINPRPTELENISFSQI